MNTNIKTFLSQFPTETEGQNKVVTINRELTREEYKLLYAASDAIGYYNSYGVKVYEDNVPEKYVVAVTQTPDRHTRKIYFKL